MLQSQYMGGPQNDLQTDAYSSLGMRLHGYRDEAEGGRLRYGYDLLGLASMDGAENAYAAVPELYLGLHSQGGLRFIVGRQWMIWSRFDEEWRLGMWQPNVRWDYLNPIPQGLTGVFVGSVQKDAGFSVFVSPLFLPDQGPNFEVVDGEFRSSNRWFRQPNRRGYVLGKDYPISYDLKRPAETEIVNHPSFGLLFRLGDDQEGPWFRLALADKPINQLHLAIQSYKNAALGHTNEIIADVYPKVARHSLLTLEGGLSNDDHRFWLSFTEERPRGPEVPEDWAESSLYDSRFYGVTLQNRLPWQGWRSHWIKFAYMQLFESVPHTTESDDSRDDIESSMDRYPYKRVGSVQWLAPLVARRAEKLELGLRYLYSIPEQGGLLSIKLEYTVNRKTRFDVGLDVIGSAVDLTDSNHGLMTEYKNNDRVLGGLTHVF